MNLLSYKDIAKIFEKIELRLIASLKRNLLRHKAEEQKYGKNWSAWQVEKLRNIERFRRENINIMNEYVDIIDDETRELMEEQFREGEEEAEQAVSEFSDEEITPVSSKHFFGVNNEKMQKLMTDVTTLEKTAETAALRMTDDIYRQTVNRVQLAMGTGETTLTKAIDMATKDFLNAGINCIVYKDGKRVNIADYVRMALQTCSARATLQGKAKRFAELGYDTVLVSAYGGCSETCEPYQGRVFIDDVFTVWNGERNGDMGKSNYCGKWFPLLSSAIRGGLFHPNCRHTLSQYIDGFTAIPKPIPADDIRIQRELEQKQRMLERKIRKLKRFAEGTQNPITAKAYRKKLRDTQHELKAFVDEYKDVLRRDYSREKYYGEVDKKGNLAKAIDMFNDNDLKPDDVTTEQITQELSKSSIGKETLHLMSEFPERIKLTYGSDPNVRGEEKNGVIHIYVNNCRNTQWVARTIIHECTHYKYGIGNSQWSECVCIAQELKHARGRDNLTISEKRTIIKAVKSDSDYGRFNWRRGGIIHGRRKSH